MYLEAEEYYKKGVFLYNLGKYADADMNFAKAIEFYEKTNDRKKLAFLWNSKGMALESLGIYHSRKNQDNQFTDVRAKKNSMYYEANGIYALDCFELALDHFNKANHPDPADIADTYRNRGYTYAKVGDYEEALECFARALDHFNKANHPDPADIADTYRNQGYAIAMNNYHAESPNRNNYDLAILSLTKSIKKCRRFSLAWNTAGYIHTMFGEYEKARECFKEATNIDPHFAKAWRNYGYVLYCIERDKQLEKTGPDEIDENAEETEKLDDVIECLNKAIEIDPHDAYAWYYRGYVYYRKKEYDNAIRHFEEAIQIRFSFYDAWYGKGMVFDSRGQYEEAVKCFDKAIELCEKGIYHKKENQKITECKKLAYMYNSKGLSLDSLSKGDKEAHKHKSIDPKKDAENSFSKAIGIYEYIQIDGLWSIYYLEMNLMDYIFFKFCPGKKR
jgi:tetratricopeptide (TPR) repeat protein